MQLSRFLRLPGPFRWCLALAFSAALVACGDSGNGNGTVTGGGGGTGTPAAGGGTPAATVFTTNLSGDQEVPPVVTGATGVGTLSVETGTRNVSGGIVLDGMTATVAHIHVGEPGVAGPVTITLVESSPGTWTIPAGTTLTQEQADALAAGNLYWNAHTTANATGEIRGQIGRDIFVSRVTSDQEVPPTGSTAGGAGILNLDPATGRITGRLTVDGMTANAAHIHSGAAGVNGPILFPLTETAAGSGIWLTAPDAVMTPEQITLLRSGGMYFNAHTTLNPGGEIRGQIARDVRFATLTGAEEVPATTSTATGTGTFIIDPATRAASGAITLNGMAATAAHVHQAPAGSNGPIIVPLENLAPNVWSVPANSTLTPDQFLAFKQENLYFNAHSVLSPEGEIRGQIR